MKAKYGLKAMLRLAEDYGRGPWLIADLATEEAIPKKFLELILLELKHARLVRARRGARGGYWLAKPAEAITIADVIRAVEGPLANIHESAPEDLHYEGAAERLRDVWVAVRANLRNVLESITLADVVSKQLGWRLEALLSDPEVWLKR